MSQTLTLDVAHLSMQFNDTPKQQTLDAEKLFSRGYDWITGTEAGEADLKKILLEAANDNSYTFTEYKSLWVAIHRPLIVNGSYSKGGETVLDNDLTKGHGNDPSIVWAEFEHVELGHICVLCSHYPRFGRPDAHDPDYRVNLPYNKQLAQAIGDKMQLESKGKSISFYAGDQNIPDTVSDTFFGEPITSAWDELKRYENTGHGPIDVIASFDQDGRVSAKYIRALSDKEEHFFTDHYLVEAGFNVRTLG